MLQKITLFSFLFVSVLSFSQTYEFQTIKEIEATPVISQGVTGTCWSFSTTSFLEAEIIRLTGKKIDLSEMYNVRNTYPKKAENYVMRQGKANFSEGGLSHDVINSVREYGLVPNSVYTGLNGLEEKHNHAELQALLEGMLKVFVDNPSKKLSPKWKESVQAVLDVYLGKNPTEFSFEGKKYTPSSFLTYTKINPDSYVSLTSFTHQPFYKSFIINIPDNFSNGSFYNLPLDEFIQNIDNALDKGFTLALDCDVSEPYFSGKYGVAAVPADEVNNKTILTEIKPEKEITPQYRQQEFENLTTQDDHLMHIVGKVKDQKGNLYYKVKNSWGTENLGNDGYIYMSVAYLKLKTISVLVHKDALLINTKRALSL
ncbi:C1 family peptidase [Flavobacterium azooxidireducens]|uniref:Aminopeptidase n=1 Tax=Flavobacterium azooxidireducens TaxID=1871076 RepID=A0ABY4KEH7_9FLAO|nr:C1 family peptidase [Flavobacterium azooxidireducens]UPQ78701.1 C1 family peptidase [Flavobacterium azooxidireducens]